MARLDTPTYLHRPHLASRIFSGFIYMQVNLVWIIFTIHIYNTLYVL